MTGYLSAFSSASYQFLTFLPSSFSYHGWDRHNLRHLMEPTAQHTHRLPGWFWEANPQRVSPQQQGGGLGSAIQHASSFLLSHPFNVCLTLAHTLPAPRLDE